MDLLGQDTQKKQKSNAQKIVLFLLIFSIFALLMTIVMMSAISGKGTKKELTISIDGTDVKMEQGLLTTDEKGTNYISIQKISKLIGFNYVAGEYKKYSDDITKCYLEDTNGIIQFETNSNKIYKINPRINLDYEEYELKNIIINQNNLLYVALEDVNVALNTIFLYSEVDNKIVLKTLNSIQEEQKQVLSEKTNGDLIQVSDDFNNKKALAYNMLVASNENGKWGVVDTTNYNKVKQNQYSTIEFIESAGVFIVSDNNKYGIIKPKKEEPIVQLNYEEIRVINNKPLHYAVKMGNVYVVVNEEGKAIINDRYDSFGCNTNSAVEESVLVVEEIADKKVNILVVCKGGKYGLLDLDNGTAIGGITLDRIYSKNDNGKKVYYVQSDKGTILLNKYIEQAKTTTVNIGQ